MIQFFFHFVSACTCELKIFKRVGCKKIADNYIYYSQVSYVPLAMEGSIIVDGILASCFTSIPNDLALIGMTPARWFP